MDRIPDDLLMEILSICNLEPKQLCSLKLLSKRLNSLISSPTFIATYNSHNPGKHPQFIVNSRLHLHFQPTESIHFDPMTPPDVYSFSINPQHLLPDATQFDLTYSHCSYLLASSNGLILFGVNLSSQACMFYVASQATQQWAPIRNQPPRPQALIASAWRQRIGLATRVNQSSVVDRFVVADFEAWGSGGSRMMWFSSEHGRWSYNWVSNLVQRHTWRYNGAFEFDGRLFWIDQSAGLIVWDNPFDCNPESRIVCRFIKFPINVCKAGDLSGSIEGNSAVGVNGGSIYFVEINYKCDCLVSKLMDYINGDGEWSLMYRLSFEDVRSNVSYEGFDFKKLILKPFTIHPIKPDVFMFHTRYEYAELNVKKGMIVRWGNRYPDFNTLEEGRMFIFDGSFVFPRWPTILPSSIRAALTKQQGDEYLKYENYNEAIYWYCKSIVLAPTPATYMNRAIAYLKIDKLSEAEDDYAKGATLDSDYFKLHARNYTYTPWFILDKVVGVNLPSNGELTKFDSKLPPHVSSFRIDPHDIVANRGELDLTRHNSPVIIASSNGLILCAVKFINQEDRLLVANPVTGQWVPVLKAHHKSLSRGGIGFVARVDSSGLADKFLVAEYRVVLKSKEASLMCFSSDNAMWLRKSLHYALGKHRWRYDGAFEFDGCLFWVDLSIGLLVWDDPINSIENQNEKVSSRFISLPIKFRKAIDEFDSSLDNKRVVGVSKGCIHFVETNAKRECYVSKLENYKVGDVQWTLIYSLSLIKLWSHPSYVAFGLLGQKLVPKFIHPLRSDVVYFETEGRNVALNVRTKWIENFSDDPRIAFVGGSSIFSVMPFVLLPRPTLLSLSQCATLPKEARKGYLKAKLRMIARKLRINC